MKLNAWIRRAVVAASFIFAALPATAQLKVAVVNLQKSLQDTAEIKQAEADLKARFGPRQEEIASMEKEIAKLTQEAEANQSKSTSRQWLNSGHACRPGSANISATASSCRKK
jgi:Skp family chaperone for outer membrane proteins